MPPIKTYTRIWKSQKILYAFQDIILPFPVPLLGAGIFLVAFLPIAGIAYGVIGLPITNLTVALFTVGFPALLAWGANKPIWEDKNLFEYLSSQVNYLMSPKVLSDLSADDEPLGLYYIVEQKIWKPTNDLTTKEIEAARKNNKKAFEEHEKQRNNVRKKAEKMKKSKKRKR